MKLREAQMTILRSSSSLMVALPPFRSRRLIAWRGVGRIEHVPHRFTIVVISLQSALNSIFFGATKCLFYGGLIWSEKLAVNQSDDIFMKVNFLASSEWSVLFASSKYPFPVYIFKITAILLMSQVVVASNRPSKCHGLILHRFGVSYLDSTTLSNT